VSSIKVASLAKIKQTYITDKGFTVIEQDESKPWGAYYHLSDDDTDAFIASYFPGLSLGNVGGKHTLSPKYLVFEPGKKLSLQYHKRRSEIWKVLQGTLIAALSDTDEEGEWREYPVGSELTERVYVRHRGGSPAHGDWVVVAEIWQHTDTDHPSDENDIVRIADDFGRA
jgi:mannose-6-phosphate isomerase